MYSRFSNLDTNISTCYELEMSIRLPFESSSNHRAKIHLRKRWGLQVGATNKYSRRKNHEGKEVDFKWTASRSNTIPGLHQREIAATTSQNIVIQREYTVRVCWLNSKCGAASPGKCTCRR